MPRCTLPGAGGLIRARPLSTSPVCEGRRRQYREHTRYPQPRSSRPDRPDKIATDALMSQLSGHPQDKREVMDSIKITDEEVNRIYESIVSADRRKERDEQSLRHMSRAQRLEMRRKDRELAAQKESVAEPSPAKEPPPQGDASEPKKSEGSISTISDKLMEEMIYVDTRNIREMEEARHAVIASTYTNQMERLQDRVRDASVATSIETSASPADSEAGSDLHLSDAHEGTVSIDAAPELSVSEFNHVIFANMLAGRKAEAMQAYDLLIDSGLQPDQTTFANLTMVHAKAGDLETAISMFKQLDDRGLQPTMYSYGTLIKAYMEFNRIDDAFRVYETMKAREMWPNLPVYNNLIVACLKVGNFKRAWGMFEHLRYTIAQPDEISFSIMIHACAKNGEVEKAMNLFEEMISSKLALSDVTFNSLIHACALRPDYFDEGFRLIQLMEANGFQPDFYTYNTLIYACARKKNLGLARDLFRDMLEKSLDPANQGLLKIDPITISNMMWAYAGYLPQIKTCSWKTAQRYESLALDVQQAIKDASATSMATGSDERAQSLARRLASKDSSTIRLAEAQEKAAEAARRVLASGSEGAVSKEIEDRQRMDLINALMPEDVPSAHNSVGSEAARLMKFYLEVLKGDVNSRLLNAYLAAMIANGRFGDAWRVFLEDFEKYNVPKDGWIFQRMIRLCARTRDVPSAWRIWDEFKSWRAEVERALKTPGCEKLNPARTKVFRADDGIGGGAKDAAGSAGTSTAELNRASKDMLALAETLAFPGENALPTIVAGGSLAVLPSDREFARSQIGCDMKAEHAVYIEMITLLGSCSDFRAAIKLIREEKTGVLEHQHNPTMEDVHSLYQSAVRAGDKHAALDIRGLCMQKPAHSARRALHRKWGTSFSWDLTDPQRKSLSRRFPEEFKRHRGPFKDGERVSVRPRK
ncbi:hypothetical protein GGI07_003767 [Coemansia sp. Benny D115]|nr:hypothetical protein GGI07_003767 [Coemansia sp. Benny D115]